MQRGYRYELTAPAGRNFDPEFRPELAPAEMLRLGVFGGKYMTDCKDEFPRRWFVGAKLSAHRFDPSLNFFGVKAGQPLSVWRRKGWLHPADPRGWFQWYCRYYRGRRLPAKMHGKSGRPCGGTSVRFRTTACRAISRAASASAKPCSSGLTTAAGYSGPSQHCE
jgi:hypothetical protein